MSEKTKIAWCDDTVNFWHGCSKVNLDCLHCYITDTAPFRQSGLKHGHPRVPHLESAERLVRKLGRKPWICENGHANVNDEFCHEDGCANQQFRRRRIFINSLSDWLDGTIESSWLARLLVCIHKTPQCDFLLLTKRPAKFLSCLRAAAHHLYQTAQYSTVQWIDDWIELGQPRHNAWIIASAGHQDSLDEMKPALLDIPARIHGLSLEPLLGPLNLGDLTDIEWIIAGGESHRNRAQARPCNTGWLHRVIDQAKSRQIPVFIKQLGSNPQTNTVTDWPKGTVFHGNEPLLRHSKGGDPDEWPQNLRIRQFPI